MAAVQRVLLIDDDEINNFICINILTKIGFSESVKAFESGLDALDYLKELLSQGKTEELPQVIFLDINMPIMNGWDFLEAYKELEKPHKIALFMLSSSIYKADVERASKYDDVVEFVTKPLNEGSINALKEKYFG